MLELTLSLNKTNYTQAEPIQATLQLKNSGSGPVVVNGRLALNSANAPEEFFEVNFLITTQSGNEVRFGSFVNIGEPEDRHFKTLEVGQSLTEGYQLQRLYQLREPSTYSVKAIYQNSSDPSNGPAWKGRVESGEVKLVVNG